MADYECESCNKTKWCRYAYDGGCEVNNINNYIKNQEAYDKFFDNTLSVVKDLFETLNKEKPENEQYKDISDLTELPYIGIIIRKITNKDLPDDEDMKYIKELNKPFYDTNRMVFRVELKVTALS